MSSNLLMSLTVMTGRSVGVTQAPRELSTSFPGTSLGCEQTISTANYVLLCTLLIKESCKAEMG